MLGKKVEVIKQEYFDDHDYDVGKVVAIVRERRRKVYIVQFKNDWSFFKKEKLRVVK